MITFDYQITACETPIAGNTWCDVTVIGTIGAETRMATLSGCTFDSQQAFINSHEYLSLRQEIEQEFIDAGIVTGIVVAKNYSRGVALWHTRYNQETLTDGIYTTEQEAWKRAYNALDDSDKRTLFYERIMQWCDDDDNISTWADSSSASDFCIVMGPEALQFYNCHRSAIWLMLQDIVDNDGEYKNIPDMIGKVTDDSNPLSDDEYMHIAYVNAAVNQALRVISNQWCGECNGYHVTEDCEA